MFAAPNTAAIMSSVPPNQRGQASGMRATFQNSGHGDLDRRVLFPADQRTARHPPRARCRRGCRPKGCPRDIAAHVASLPPVSSVFAAFLGFNPLQTLLEPTGVLAHLPARSVQTLTGKEFFPHLISQPFHHGLVVVFTAAATHGDDGRAWCPLMRGSQYYHGQDAARPSDDEGAGRQPGSTASGAEPWQDGVTPAQQTAPDRST